MGMKLEDVLLHWIQIRIVEERRPDDNAAKETTRFFARMLREDFQVIPSRYEAGEEQYALFYRRNDGEEKVISFPKEAVDKLYEDIIYISGSG
jgi:hypothetical protein